MLLIFDLDGTLCLSSDLDDACYIEACRRVIGAPEINTDWAAYPDATDPVIGRTLIQKHVDGAANDATLAERTLAELESVFVGLVAQRAEPTTCREVPGAGAMLSVVAQTKRVFGAIATGGWRRSALAKLRAAGVDVPMSVPLRTSNEATRRIEIIAAARDAASDHAGRVFGPEETVYFGDGVWDLAATRELGIGFVGVGAERGKGERLRDAGAPIVIEHFADNNAAMDAARAALGARLG